MSTAPVPDLSAWVAQHAQLRAALAAEVAEESWEPLVRRILLEELAEPVPLVSAAGLRVSAAVAPVLRVYRAVFLADSLFRLPLSALGRDIRDPRKDMGFNHIVPAMRNRLS